MKQEYNIFDIKKVPIPLNKTILVYVKGDNEWKIDYFAPGSKSDHYQPNGKYYPHNISHWCYLPNKINNAE